MLARYRQEMDRDLYAHLPLDGDHLTAMVPTTSRTTVTSAGDFETGADTFRVTAVAGDTVVTYLSFDLDTLAGDSIRVVKLWVAGRADAPEDRPLGVAAVDPEALIGDFAWAGRPAAGRTLGTVDVNDERRFDLAELDVTDYVREVIAAGDTRVAFTFVAVEGSASRNVFQSEGFVEAYPPQLQVVYDEAGDSEPPVSTRAAVAPAISVVAYPNPTPDRLRLLTAATGYDLTVEDAAGRGVLRREGLSGAGTGAGAAALTGLADLNPRARPAATATAPGTASRGRVRPGSPAKTAAPPD